MERRRLGARISIGLATAMVVSALAACSAGPGDETSAPSPSRASEKVGVPSSPEISGNQVEKVLLFVVENRSMRQMQDGMPFITGLAATYGYADHYQALAHPSLPNYLAIAGGTTSGVTDDRLPSVHGRSGPSVFGQALTNGRTAKVYNDGMPEPCYAQNGGDGYVARHNPWTYQLDERHWCERFDGSMAPFAADVAEAALPDVGMVVPNLCHDAHNCSVGDADRWMQDRIEAVMAGPDWVSGRLAIVITADEDETRPGEDPDNGVLTVVVHPALDGIVVTTPLTHLSLSRALSEVAGGVPLAEAADAASLWDAFGLRVPQ